MSKEMKGVFIVLLAGITWGMQNVWVKMLSAYNLESLQICFIKMFVAAIGLVILLLINDPKAIKIDIKDIWMFLGTGIVSATGFSYFGFYTTIRGGVAISVVLTYTAPIFVLIFSAILFKEKITVKKIVAIILTLFGCVLTAGLIGGGYRFETIVIITGLAAGFFFSLYSIFSTFALKKYPSLAIIAWTFIIGAISCLPFAKVPQLVATAVAQPQMLVWAILLGLFSGALPYFCYTTGLSMMDPSKASVISSFELVVGSLAGMIIFNEPHDLAKIIGIVIILIGIIVLNIDFKKKKTEINTKGENV